jgi:hypothetical protein
MLLERDLRGLTTIQSDILNPFVSHYHFPALHRFILPATISSRKVQISSPICFTALLCKACKWWTRCVFCPKQDEYAVVLRGAIQSCEDVCILLLKHGQTWHRGVHESIGKSAGRRTLVDRSLNALHVLFQCPRACSKPANNASFTTSGVATIRSIAVAQCFRRTCCRH